VSQHKRGGQNGRPFCVKPQKLTRDGTDRASINTCAAIGTGVSINHVLVGSFADGIDRTAVYTSSTVDTFVRNCVSHTITSFVGFFTDRSF
jgi:hypothetical protein